VPTFLLVLGASTAAALLPVLIPLRPVFYPLTLLMLTGTLMWGTSRTGRSRRRTRHAGDTGDAAAQTPPAVPDTQWPRPSGTLDQGGSSWHGYRKSMWW